MATKKKSTSPTSTFSPPADAPANLEAWRALYPEPKAQRTIDEIISGLHRAREDGNSSVLHSTFEDEVGVPIKKQPTDAYIWLCQAKSLWLTNVTPFDDVVLKDVRPLAVFTQLELLEIDTTLDTDLMPLSALLRLRRLYVRGGERSDWSWLAALSKLELLQVSASHVGHEKGEPAQTFSVAGHKRLKRFQWSGHFNDVSHLGLGPQVEKVELFGQIADISTLASVHELKELNVRGCQVRDISPLLSLGKLECLDISRNRVAALDGIESLKKLSELDANYNCISDLQPYRTMMEEEDQDDVDEWIERTERTQLKLTIPEARAVYDDWLNLDKWKALADVLEANGDPMGGRIRLRLANDSKSGLPFYWARGTMTRDPSWK